MLGRQEKRDKDGEWAPTSLATGSFCLVLESNTRLQSLQRFASSEQVVPTPG